MNASGLDGWADATNPDVGPQPAPEPVEDAPIEDVPVEETPVEEAEKPKRAQKKGK